MCSTSTTCTSRSSTTASTSPGCARSSGGTTSSPISITVSMPDELGGSILALQLADRPGPDETQAREQSLDDTTQSLVVETGLPRRDDKQRRPQGYQHVRAQARLLVQPLPVEAQQPAQRRRNEEAHPHPDHLRR